MNNMPKLIYGTAWKKERTRELVEKAIISGFKGVDTACQPKHYHEPGVGQALQNLKRQGIRRESLYIQTKFTPLPGQDPFQLPYKESAPLTIQIKQSLEASLRNLQVSFIDGYLLHSPLTTLEQTMEAWREMEKLYQSGKIGFLGISNCYSIKDLKLIYQEAYIKPKILQNRFYADTNYDEDLRKFCQQNEIAYQAFWTLTANPHILSHPVLISLALNHDVTQVQLFYRFLTQLNILPLIGTSSEKHMKEDLAIFEFALNEEEMSKISDLLY